MAKKEKEVIDSVLDSTLKELEKSYGKGIITNLEDDESLQIDKVSCGHMSLDKALGGGIPRGRILEFYGANSSGKSTLALSVIREFQLLGENVVYLDAEYAFDKDYAQKNGVDVAKLIFCQPEYTEQGLDIVEKFVESGKIGLIVVDSIAAMSPKAEIEGEAGDSHMGLQARLMSQAFRRLTGKIHKSNTTVIFINQTRKNIGVMWGSPITTTSGEALKFYSSIRVELAKTGMNKKGDVVLATTVKAKIVKNKVAAPYKDATFDIYFDSGICRITDLVNVALEKDVIKKSGAWFSYEGNNISQGLENLRDLLKENKELFEKIKKEVKEK
ncbi:MAG: recombinase RecA [Patescibacteria group bacterium]|jgi:recombination protein RecA